MTNCHLTQLDKGLPSFFANLSNVSLHFCVTFMVNCSIYKNLLSGKYNHINRFFRSHKRKILCIVCEFSVRKIVAEEAKRLGLVNHIFPKENFRSRVTEYVESITTNGPMALQVVKEIIDSTFALDEDQALAFEREKAASNVLSSQCVEGITAFLEKREPKWAEKAGSG